MRPRHVLVLGISGMLGHELARVLMLDGFQVSGTARAGAALHWDGVWRLEATQRGEVETLLADLKPDVVVNCIGWVRQRPTHGRLWEAILVNAVLPHWLADTCRGLGIGLIHISTDCVHDADWYGASKSLGETICHGAVLRTSFIGHELERKHGLLEWALAQRGKVKGYRQALWNGLTTLELSRVIAGFVVPRLERLQGGTWEVCGPDINKGELLALINDVYELGLEVEMVDEPAIDRRLDRQALQKTVGYVAPSWRQMLQDLRRIRERPALAV